MKTKLTVKIFCYVLIGIIIASFYVYFQHNPAVLIRTEISPIDEKTYKQLGLNGIDIKKYHEISFSLKVNYPNEIENLEVKIPLYFTELLGNDIYLGANYKEYNDHKKYQFVHEAEIILYTGEVSNEDIKNLLNEGNVLLGWDYKGESVQQTYNIGETVLFTR